MSTTSASGNNDRTTDRNRELEHAIRHALVLAAGKRVADRALRRARVRALAVQRRRFGRTAAHLAGYGTLLAYIWHKGRAGKHSAARA